MLENSIFNYEYSANTNRKVKEIQKVTNKEWLDNLEDRSLKN